MASWFVSTTRRVDPEAEWLLTPCAKEDEASEALIRGRRVEARTLPGVGPKKRIGWREARDWAQSSNAGASLRRRLNMFAG